VHPDDERHRHLIGKMLVLPVLGREIPVVADTFVDREFGTGAVKLTPAHDANDFAAAQRLGLPSINIMDERAVLNENAGPYQGQDRFKARAGIVAQLEQEGLLLKTEPHPVPLGHCQRCGTVVEPRLSRQWFVKMLPLAEPALAAAEDGRIRFVPESWTKTYFEWMRNIRDWCISRQLWWGHRIPAWTCAKDHVTVAREAPAACAECGSKELVQETDVLDTWFSSGLFPFSTLGWPDKTKELARYYPNDVMMTGYDILFFWVARMIMSGMRFAGGPPFPVVFLNGLVRDEHGKKMSKTKGNDVDPLELVARHGTDAVRFTMTALGAPGTNPSLSEARLAGYRAFVNKLWNASRFLMMNLEGERAAAYEFRELPLPSRWILSRQQDVARKVGESLAEFRFDQAANDLYHFVWDEFCDWYIEIAKSYFADPVEGPRTRAVLLEVLEKTLRLLHPVMPFVTEEIWQRLPHEGPSIMVAPYPVPEPGKSDVEDEAAMARVMRLITGIRTLRATYGVDRKRRIDVTVVAPIPADAEFVRAQSALVRHLAGLGTFEVVAEAPDAEGTLRQPVDGVELRVAMAGLFDVAAEKARLTRDLAKIDEEAASLGRKFENPQFASRAKPEVVAQARQRMEELVETRAKIAATLAELGRLA
jgi:valyl-tRNA synthetase